MRRDTQRQPERVLASFPRKDGEEVRFVVSAFNGTEYFHFRKYFRAADGSMRATKAGVAVRQSELAQLASAIDRVLGIEPPDDGATGEW